MSSKSETTSPSMPNTRAENGSSRAPSQEDSMDRSDISSSKNSSPVKSSANKPAAPKKQKASDKMAKPTVTDKDDNALDEDPGHEHRLSSPKATITHKKPASKVAPVGEVDSDDVEAEERPTKKHPAAKAKKNAEAPDNVTPTVSEADDAESTEKPAPTSKPRKRRAAIPTSDGARKKAKLPANAYTPDSYDEATWKELVEEFNLEIPSDPKVTTDALRKRWPRVKAAATEIEHGDIQKMCIYKQDMEVQLETTREELLAKFERDKEAILRKFKADMWTEIAKYVGRNGGNQYEPATLQRKYGVYQRQGRIDTNDKYLAWTDQDEKERKARERSKTLMNKNDAEASEGDDEEPDVEDKAEEDDDDEEDDVGAKGEDTYLSHAED
ncbi:hypothetical protein EAF04_004413 [Stromatinia cepivora]|nr:hypothetical protein EAF04_004413 [Stromatinia cepivora]